MKERGMIFKSRKTLLAALGLVALFLIFGAFSCSSDSTVERTPEAALKALRQGNERFAAGEAVHPRTDAARLAQAGTESQGDHAYATVLACSDSRVPVERLFDAGVMDIFVVRVAGNVVQGDEAGSIEYGLAHVKTPVLVVLGHTQCGAVTAGRTRSCAGTQYPRSGQARHSCRAAGHAGTPRCARCGSGALRH
jgi:carbonic anhydrase